MIGPTSTTRSPHLGSYEATNPCGEQPLLPYDVCQLGKRETSGPFVRSGLGSHPDPDHAVDWDGLGDAVQLATHFLDNVIDANRYPLPAIHDLSQTHTAALALGLWDGPTCSYAWGFRTIPRRRSRLPSGFMGFVNEECRKASERLAESRGVFPEWEHSIWGEPDETAARDSRV